LLRSCGSLTGVRCIGAAREARDGRAVTRMVGPKGVGFMCMLSDDRPTLADVLSRLAPIDEEFPGIDDPPTRPTDPLGAEKPRRSGRERVNSKNAPAEQGGRQQRGAGRDSGG